jgi:4-amino-4-deoxy-L-arabinose transferase-like glycosyltransferase
MPTRWLLPLVLVGGGTVALVAYLLHRFPFDGLYGQDAYAYYFQARALFEEAAGRSPVPGALFGTNGLQHWPVGYHLQIIAGFLLGGEGLFGPRLLTLAMAVACPVLVYTLLGRFMHNALWVARLLAGLVSAAMLPLNATYTRMGISLMSDIPALFWTLLAVLFFLRLVPPVDDAAGESSRYKRIWAIGFGAALGVAVLTRYGVAAFVPALLCYSLANLVAWRKVRPDGDFRWRGVITAAAWSVLAFVVALIPQAAYLATHNPGTTVSDSLSGFSLSNLFSSVSVSADGTASFAQPMIAFYLVNPFWDTASGYLSIFFLPLVLFGLVYLVRLRSWDLLVLLVTWWLIPGLVYASTPYQAQRFTLLYLPAIAIVAGLGIYMVVEIVLKNRLSQNNARAWAWRSVGLILVVALALGAVQCWKSVSNWAATHAAWQAQDDQVAILARFAADRSSSTDKRAHVISFGATAALYYYTGWPTLELFNTDQKGVEQFVSTSEPTVVVIPVDSMTTQWAGRPVGDMWQWMQSHYTLTAVGQSGVYTVFQLSGTSQHP